MATIDEIRKTEQALARRGTPMPYTAQAGDRAAAVSNSGRAAGASGSWAPGASGSWSPADQTTPQPAVAPVRSFGTRVGQFARGRVNRNLDVAEAAANLSALPVRQFGGVARDAAYGLVGANNPNEGRLAGSSFSLPRLGAQPTPASAATPAAGGRQRVNPIVMDGTTPDLMPNSYLRQRPNPAPTASTASAAPAAAPVPPPADGIYRGRDTRGNSVYGGSAAELQQGVQLANGQRPGVAGGIATAAAPAAEMAAQPPVVQPPVGGQAGAFSFGVSGTGANPTGRALGPVPGMPGLVAAPANNAPQYAARGRQGGIIRNPDQGSLANQIAQAMGDSRLRGSPSGRRAVAEALLGEAGYRNDERQSALATGDKADLGALDNQAAANEAFAKRRFDASQFNVTSAQDQQQLDNDRTRSTGTFVRGLDGGYGSLRSDGSVAPLPGGYEPVTSTDQRGQITAQDRWKSLDEREKALMAGGLAPDPAALSQIQQERQQLLAQQAAPRVGTIEGGRRFKGGNPADRNNWEVVR